MSADLVRFVEARIAEDEAWASEIGGTLYPEPYDEGAPAHHDRLLRQCEAFRRIIELHKPMTLRPEQIAKGYLPNCEGCWEEGGEDGAPTYPCRTARHLASIWSAHDDYRKEWTP